MNTKRKYKFMGSDGDVLIWESVNEVAPHDSRVERIICAREWFWQTAVAK